MSTPTELYKAQDALEQAIKTINNSNRELAQYKWAIHDISEYTKHNDMGAIRIRLHALLGDDADLLPSHENE